MQFGSTSSARLALAHFGSAGPLDFAALVHFGAPLDCADANLLETLEAALIAGLSAGEGFLDTPGLTGAQVPDGSPFAPLVPPDKAFRHDDPASAALARVTRVLTRLSRWRNR